MSEHFGHENPYLGIYSKADGIHLRVIARAADEPAARRLIVPIEQAIHDRLAPYIWGYDDETPQQAVAQALQSRNKTLAVMELCTGGFLSNAITEAPDAARHFRGGIIAYAPESLTAAGVPPKLLANHGAASQEAANAMSAAALTQLNADYGIGVTGAPGPAELDGRPPGPRPHRHLPRHPRRPASNQGTGAPRPPAPNNHQAPPIQPGPNRTAPPARCG